MTVRTICIGIGVIIGVMAILWVRKRRKKIQDNKFQVTKKFREDSLKEALANNLISGKELTSEIPHRPYRVNYSTGENQKNREKQPLLQIIEKSKLSEKKYIFRANETVILGIQFGSACILNNMESGDEWCELFYQKDAYCVRALEKHNISVQRNKKIAIVDECGLRLKTKDIIKIQDTVFRIFYVKG